MINSVIPMWKPVDWSSFDVVKYIRNQIKPSKVGHAGTLDPFAEGVLMLCTGNKTKNIESFMDEKKEYIAEIVLGIETDTLDQTGKIIKIMDIPKFNKQALQNVLYDFIGAIMQEPPMYSALKHNGQPLYKLARKGITVYRKKRLVNIYDIQVQNFSLDSILINIKCGRGTYIRSLARDIAVSLGTVGHLKSLKRTRIGNINQKNCITIEEFPEWISAMI